jgi:hypothetical protein
MASDRRARRSAPAGPGKVTPSAATMLRTRHIAAQARACRGWTNPATGERNRDHDSRGGGHPPSHRDLPDRTPAGRDRAGRAGRMAGRRTAGRGDPGRLEFATNAVVHSASRHGARSPCAPKSARSTSGSSTGTPAGASPGPGSAGETRVTVLPPPADAARVSCFLADQPRRSIYWDKKYGLWRVAEDDPEAGPDRSR